MFARDGTKKLLVNKWVTLVCGMYTLIGAGVMYLFSVYSPNLKDELDYSETDINAVGSLSNAMGYLGIFAGLFYDRFGPRRTIWIGVLLAALGWTLFYLGATKTLPHEYWMMGIYAGIAANSQTWFDTGVVSTNIRNFPHCRGLVIGILKSFTGLSASIFTLLYGFFKPGVNEFLLFIAIIVPVLATAMSLFINLVPVRSSSGIWDDRPRRFYIGYAVTGCLAVYILVVSIVEDTLGLSNDQEIPFRLIGVLALFPLLLVPYKSGPLFAEVEMNEDGDDGVEDEKENLMSGASEQKGDSASTPLLMEEGCEEKTVAKQGAIAPRDINALQCLANLDWWLLAISMMCGMGAGLTFTNNVGNLVKSLGEHDGDQNVFVAIFSVFNAGGRMVAGSLSEYTIRSIPRPWYITFNLASMTLVYLYLAYATVPMLYLAAMICGASFGGYWALLPSTCSELFGLTHFGANYNLVGFAPSIGGYLLSTTLAGKLYDSKVVPGTHDCFGEQCFQLSFFIICGVCAFGTIVSFVLATRSKDIYTKMYPKL